MTKIFLHLRRGQTEGLTATQRMKVVFNNNKWYCTLTSNDLIFATAYKIMRKIGIGL